MQGELCILLNFKERENHKFKHMEKTQPTNHIRVRELLEVNNDQG